MRKKRFLAAILLSLSFCFVSGVGYGELTFQKQPPFDDEPELRDDPLYWDFHLLDVKVWYLEQKTSFLEAQIHYMMRNPTIFLQVNFRYDASWWLDLPKKVNTKEKVLVKILDNRDVFSYKTGVALLNQFKRSLEVIYSFIDDMATDMSTDIVAGLYSMEGIPLAYFYQGEYHLWEE